MLSLISCWQLLIQISNQIFATTLEATLAMKQLLLLCLVLSLAFETSAILTRTITYVKKVWKSDHIWNQITRCTDIKDGDWYDFILVWLGIRTPEKTAKALSECREKLRKKVQEGVKDPLGYIKLIPGSKCDGNRNAQFELFSFIHYKRRTLPC